VSHLSATIKSAALRFDTHIEVIFPWESAEAPVKKILYLLHGLSDNCTAWLYKTRIAKYARENQYMVVMPEVQRSFYSDMAHGSKYFAYVSRELPEICEKIFNIKHTRENTFVAGLSMGGYGAMKCALARPDFYAATASFSGALDMKTRVEMAKQPGQNQYPEMTAILGEGLIIPDASDLFYLAREAVKLPIRPRVLVACGETDQLLEDNRRFTAHMQVLNYDHRYMEWPGRHNWDFWEECLPLAFDFFEGRVSKEGARQDD